MKKLLSHVQFLLIGLLLTSMATSCDQNDVNTAQSDDDALLIEAIQNSTLKSAVTTNDLPSASQVTLESSYAESYTENAALAENLGYEVNRRCHKGDAVGERYNAYFNLEGRELKAENSESAQNRNRHQNQHRYRYKQKRCFEYELPVSFTMPDSSVINIASETDWELIKLWYVEHPESEIRPAVVFPATVIFDDGTMVTLENEDELALARELCDQRMLQHVRMHKCFHYVLPISFTMPDETTLTIATKSDWQNLKDWCSENVDAETKPTLQFPVEIVFKDSSTMLIENIEALDAVRTECKEQRKENSLFERNITSPLIYIDECDYPVSGIVEILFEDEVVAIIDYGDGTCDNIASITVDGQTIGFELNGKRWRKA